MGPPTLALKSAKEGNQGNLPLLSRIDRHARKPIRFGASSLLNQSLAKVVPAVLAGSTWYSATSPFVKIPASELALADSEV